MLKYNDLPFPVNVYTILQGLIPYLKREGHAVA